MKYRATFVIGAAVGYVLGSKAGRERYEQLKRAARKVADNPTVQEAAGTVRSRAGELADTARSRAGELAGSAKEKMNGRQQPDEELSSR